MVSHSFFFSHRISLHDGFRVPSFDATSRRIISCIFYNQRHISSTNYNITTRNTFFQVKFLPNISYCMRWNLILETTPLKILITLDKITLITIFRRSSSESSVKQWKLRRFPLFLFDIGHFVCQSWRVLARLYKLSCLDMESLADTFLIAPSTSLRLVPSQSTSLRLVGKKFGQNMLFSSEHVLSNL